MLSLDIPQLTAMPVIWFLLIAVLWIGFFVLEGFDFGVAMLYPVIGGKSDVKRRVMVNAIGPTWDGNEVWLLTAGGAMFAAFPGWYATLFSALYLPLLLVLLGLIARGIAFEYRSTHPDTKWRNAFDWCSTIGSFIVTLVLGVGFGNFVRGLKVGPDMLIAGGFVDRFFGLFTPYALLSGIMFVVLFAAHGAQFLAIKTKSEVEASARKTADLLTPIAAALVAIFVVWGALSYPLVANPFIGGLGTVLRLVVGLLAVICLVGAWYAGRKNRPGLAFIGSALGIVTLVASIFVSMFGTLGFIDASGGALASLNIVTAASSNLTLTLMTVVACIMVPVVLGYTAWAYWVFRKRLDTTDIPVEA